MQSAGLWYPRLWLAPRKHEADQKSQGDANADGAPGIIVDQFVGRGGGLFGAAHERFLQLRQTVAALFDAVADLVGDCFEIVPNVFPCAWCVPSFLLGNNIAKLRGLPNRAASSSGVEGGAES